MSGGGLSSAGWVVMVFGLAAGVAGPLLGRVLRRRREEDSVPIEGGAAADGGRPRAMAMAGHVLIAAPLVALFALAGALFAVRSYTCLDERRSRRAVEEWRAELCAEALLTHCPTVMRGPGEDVTLRRRAEMAVCEASDDVLERLGAPLPE